MEELEKRVTKLETAHDQHLQNHEYTPSWVVVFRLASISFLSIFILAIASIKIKYEAFSFEVPTEALLTALSAPSIAALVTGCAAYLVRSKK